MVDSTFVRQRVTAPRTAALLGIGDLIALGAFAVMGAIQHGPPPLAAPVNVVETTLPFALAWVAVALLADLYGPAATTGLRTLLLRAIPAWLLAAPIGLALRATPWFAGGVQLSFAIVATVVQGTILLGWRSLAAAALARSGGS